jgi:hypothetical protein
MTGASWPKTDLFHVLDLVARLEDKSSNSLFFELGKQVDRNSRIPEMERAEDGSDRPDKWDWLLATEIGTIWIGTLDVHYPCENFHKLRLRVSLPVRYLQSEHMREIACTVVATLGLPADVTYRIDMVANSDWISMQEPWLEFESTQEG